MTSTSSTEVKLAHSPALLKRRLAHFLSASARGTDVDHVLKSLSSVGKVAVFGGLLRDLALDGTRAAPRDIDLVVECERREDLVRFLAPLKPEQNRYGGLRFKTAGWSFDAWCVRDTWAVREGIVRAENLRDLVRTTFFDWDAVLFDRESSSFVVLPDYFQRLSSATVDVNLLENPNPVGNLVRALRFMVLGRANLGTRLAQYTWNQLSSLNERQILEVESASYRNSCLTRERLHRVRVRLESAIIRQTAAECFSPRQMVMGGIE